MIITPLKTVLPWNWYLNLKVVKRWQSDPHTRNPSSSYSEIFTIIKHHTGKFHKISFLMIYILFHNNVKYYIILFHIVVFKIFILIYRKLDLQGGLRRVGCFPEKPTFGGERTKSVSLLALPWVFIWGTTKGPKHNSGQGHTQRALRYHSDNPQTGIINTKPLLQA